VSKTKAKWIYGVQNGGGSNPNFSNSDALTANNIYYDPSTTIYQAIQNIGYSGIQGPLGQTGLQGIQGRTGVVGLGLTGLQGLQGITGPSGGPVGNTGVPGFTGVKGNTGLQGLTGLRGPTGIGAQGLTGVPGQTGLQGITGPSDGPQGATGIQGATGVGSQGIQGNQGATGIQGVGHTGLQGQAGNQGPTGVQGPQGIQGPDGYLGSTGIQGPAGPQGAGSTGLQGLIGVQGQTGVKGSTGIQGSTGLQGTQGQTGIQGQTGVQGCTGPAGSNQIDFNPISRYEAVNTAGAEVWVVSSSTVYSSLLWSRSGTTLTVYRSGNGHTAGNVVIVRNTNLDYQVAPITYADSTSFQINTANINGTSGSNGAYSLGFTYAHVGSPASGGVLSAPTGDHADVQLLSVRLRTGPISGTTYDFVVPMSAVNGAGANSSWSDTYIPDFNVRSEVTLSAVPATISTDIGGSYSTFEFGNLGGLSRFITLHF